MFHGDQRTITHARDLHFRSYDALDGTLRRWVDLESLYKYELGAHWIHEDALRFAMCLKADGKHVVKIYEARPTSSSLLRVLSSFPVVRPQSGKFSFSQHSLRASFVTATEIIILDVLNSEFLLDLKTTERYLPQTGQFSPDGRFFACGVSGHRIWVWRHTLTGYVPWSNLRARLPFDGLSWSPTSTSIVCRGQEGIQLLHPDNSLSPLTLDEVEPFRLPEVHLVTYSADGAYVAMARKRGGVVMVHDRLLGTSQQFTNTDMEIQDIKVVDNTVFVVDEHKLVGWNLEAGGTVQTVNENLAIPNNLLQVYILRAARTDSVENYPKWKEYP